MGRWLGVVLLLISTTAQALDVRVDHASVTSERRGTREWIRLDAQASAEVGLPLGVLLSVIEDYPAYPRLFSKIKQVSHERLDDATLLTQKVVVSALGIENVNRFTLRMVRTQETGSARLEWTQYVTDGSIDSLEGFWSLEDTGSSGAPRTRVVYRTVSAVPVVVPGQSLFVGMFLGSEVRGVLEAVAKEASNR